MKNSDQPINPCMYTRVGDGENDFEPLKDGKRTGWEVKFGGLTKREYFAAMAMQGLLSTPDKGEFSSIDEMLKECANLSVKAADQLLKQLENK